MWNPLTSQLLTKLSPPNSLRISEFKSYNEKEFWVLSRNSEKPQLLRYNVKISQWQQIAEIDGRKRGYLALSEQFVVIAHGKKLSGTYIQK
jgi:hypothetical protein